LGECAAPCTEHPTQRTGAVGFCHRSPPPRTAAARPARNQAAWRMNQRAVVDELHMHIHQRPTSTAHTRQSAAMRYPEHWPAHSHIAGDGADLSVMAAAGSTRNAAVWPSLVAQRLRSVRASPRGLHLWAATGGVRG